MQSHPLRRTRFGQYQLCMLCDALRMDKSLRYLPLSLCSSSQSGPWTTSAPGNIPFTSSCLAPLLCCTLVLYLLQQMKAPLLITCAACSAYQYTSLMLVIGVSQNDPHTDTKCEHIDGMQHEYCLLYVTFGNQNESSASSITRI